jgi:hypothetical protein
VQCKGTFFLACFDAPLDNQLREKKKNFAAVQRRVFDLK